MNTRSIFISFFYLFLVFPSWSQIVEQDALSGDLEEKFSHRVKVMDEFFDRFNYKSGPQDIPLPIDPDQRYHRELLSTLFDEEYFKKASPEQREDISNFIHQICNPLYPVTISPQDKNWYAVSHWQAKLYGKEIELQLVFVPEQIDGFDRWSIASVYSPALDTSPEKKQPPLSPISHNLDFFKLKADIFRNPGDVETYADQHYKKDLRAIFFYLIKTGQLELGASPRPEYIFHQVDGWSFMVKHFEREGMNTGWRIASLEKKSNEEKQQYINEHLHIYP